MNPVIETKNLSKWYGNVLGLSDVFLQISSGITGLLGPNGAGKSTLLSLITGQIKPSIGSVSLLGERIRNNYPLLARIGYCPERDSFYEEMTGWQYLTGLLKLGHFSSSQIESLAEKALDIVELVEDKHRVIRSYSQGMRQRLKFAQAIAHNPEVLILDEPLNGLDPLGKRKLISLIKSYRQKEKTVLVSSHVLPEIEALTQQIILIHQGKIFAQGDIHYIRDLLETHPHKISIRCSHPRKMASEFIHKPYVLKVSFGTSQDSLIVETNNRDGLFSIIPSLSVKNNIQIDEITSPDDNLQAVFDYLVGK